MNDQEFDNVTRSLRKSWSRQGTRNLRTYVLELQAMRNELGEAISLLAELRNDSTDTGARGRIDGFLAGTQGRVKAHVAAGIGADPQAQPVVTGFDTNSQAIVYQYMGGWWVQVPGQPRYAVASREEGETWARENGYGIVRK